jgi:predicted class III extradiol MEMO1 family dioxygenase
MASFSKKFPVPGKSADVIYTSIATGIEHFLSKTPLGNVDIERDEAAKKVSFKSSMASGSLTATDGELNVEISLSLLASAFKGKIDEGVTKWLTKTFNA